MGLKDKIAKAIAKRIDHPESEDSLTQEKEELEREIPDTYQAAERERSYRFHAQRGEERFETGRYVRSALKERELNKERRELQERHKYVEDRLARRRKEVVGPAQYDPSEEEEEEKAKPKAKKGGKSKPVVKRVIGGLNDVGRAVDAVYGDTPRRRYRGSGGRRRTRTYYRGDRRYTRVDANPFGGVDMGDPFGFGMGAGMFDLGGGYGGGGGGGPAPTRVTISIGGGGGGQRRKKSNDPFGFGQALDFGFGGRNPDRGILTL